MALKRTKVDRNTWLVSKGKHQVKVTRCGPAWEVVEGGRMTGFGMTIAEAVAEPLRVLAERQRRPKRRARSSKRTRTPARAGVTVVKRDRSWDAQDWSRWWIDSEGKR